MSKYGTNFFNEAKSSNCFKVKISGYKYNIRYLKSYGNLSNSCNNGNSWDLDEKSVQYLIVSCATIINSSIHCFNKSSASEITDLIGKDINFHLICGMIQYAHVLLHHSAILRYS